jgi:hypothetical protein
MWKELYSIPTDENNITGVFPTCKKCYDRSAGKEIIIALNQLRTDWIQWYDQPIQLEEADKKINYAIDWVLASKGF